MTERVIHPIEAWLRDPKDYWAGLKLYDTYSERPRYPRLRHTLGFGPDDYNWLSIKEELTWLLQNVIVHSFEAEKVVAEVEPATDQQPAGETDSLPKQPTTEEIDEHLYFNRLPDEGKELVKEWKGLYAQSASLHATLIHLPSDEERKKAAKMILENFDQIHVNWDKLDYYQKHGHFPAKPVVEPTPDQQDPAALMRRLNNLRSQVSKQKDNANRQTEVIAWRKEIETIEEALGIKK
ncbi:hypothetical protein [Xanthocytophaga agilis]|uniref:Uncharacterized protein n=1 Tax=Xanthocytophaga agilis TaxID=3048010 RepID=A0AAE3R2K2_9BACT|nr:hypothetical protein [Xanthocytophaga agilis]MDJ1500464.1 hypothetical protein [Xanthocytophaga agilis]